MKIKEGVRLKGIQPEMSVALQVANSLFVESREELVITSVSDGFHMAGSLHYAGHAVDLRRPIVSELAQELARRLGEEFDVVLEEDHIHVEYDPK